MKKILALTLAMLLVFALVACADAPGPAPVAPSPTPAPGETTDPADDTQPPLTPLEGPANVAVIIKATTSDFWQFVLIGANNYAVENPDRVSITTHGPPNEADIDQQVSILEDVIAMNPDAIVIASTSSDATVPALERAVEAGIVVITIDNRVHTDVVHSFLATDNRSGGAMAAEYMHGLLVDAHGDDLSGMTIGVISAMAGVQVLIDRDEGFINRMRELAPGLVILDTRYTDNDMANTMTAVEDIITANPDIIGIFADNNTTGSGTSRVITERNLHDDVVVVAFDSDPEQVAGLESGAINALVLQDPFGMGYRGVGYALQMLAGQSIPREVDTGATLVTSANMHDPEIVGLLDPTTLRR